MKKFLSVVLALTMIVSMFTTASAKTIAEYTDGFVPNPLELQLDVEVLARESSSGNEYNNSLAITALESEAKGVDYRSTLDMEPIRILFDENFISSVLTEGGSNVDNAALQEFGNGTVTTTVNVVIDYPTSAIIDGNLSSAGGLVNNNGIFTEKSRSANQTDRRVTITYVNTDNLKVSTLQSDIDNYLADLTFELVNTVTYSELGNHTVTVTLSGETAIKFSSKEQRVIYNGQASHIVNVSRDTSLLNHILAAEPAVAATCLYEGYTEGTICATHDNGEADPDKNTGYSCGADGVKKPTEIPKLNHKVNGTSLKVYINAVESTCTSTGMTAHWTCALCKSDFDSEGSDTVVPHADYITKKKAHTPVVDPGKAATCKDPGYEEGSHCGVCGTVIKAQKLINVSSTHTGIEDIGVTKAATCETDGSIKGQRCNDCGKVFESLRIVPAKGHDYGNWEIVKDATETEEGLKQRTCKNDSNHVETDVIPKKAHVTHVADPAKDVVVEPTCTKAGKKTQYCYYCDDVIDVTDIPATGHKLSHITAIAATCTETGIIEHYNCEVCGEKYRDEAATKKLSDVTEPVNRFNHPELEKAKIPAVKATCEKEGLTEGEKCKACNVVLTAQEKTPLSDEHVLEYVKETAATCIDTGVKEHYHCAVCNKDFAMNKTTEWTAKDFIISATGHSYGEGVPNDGAPLNNGFYEGTKTCGTCGDVKNVQVPADKNNCTHYVLTRDGEGKDHKTESIIIKELTKPTCTQEGKNQKVCSLCDKVIEDNISVPKLKHVLEYVAQVNPTCRRDGAEGYWKCINCGQMFKSANASEPIDKPGKLDKISQHDFRDSGNGYNECRHCNERVKVEKKDKDGKPTNKINAEVTDHGHIKNDDQDDVDQVRGDIKDDVKIESVIKMEERKQVSKKLEDGIREDAGEEKYVLDIVVEKVTTYGDGENADTDREIIDETDSIITIEIDIPESMHDMVDYMVHRLHAYKNSDGTLVEEVEEITTRKNSYGEYIELDLDNHKIILHVRRFSEYAVVGYETVVNPPAEDYTSGGGGSSSYTVKFNANGGTAIENIVVKRGGKITLPTPTREGYVFVGWYTDAALTKLFDADKAVYSAVTLYAKWVEVSECRGIEEDNCPCLNYTDLDPTLWYHRGVDYVLNNGMMIGVADTQFAPDWNTTRAMLVTVLWRAEGKPGAIDSTFTDLEDGLYYVDAVNWAAANGVVNGYSDTVFAPNDTITREQFAAIMYRYAKLKGYDVSVAESTDISAYTDYAEISEYAIPAMQYTAGSGLITGRTETTLNPKANTTRAEMATILYRFFTESK